MRSAAPSINVISSCVQVRGVEHDPTPIDNDSGRAQTFENSQRPIRDGQSTDLNGNRNVKRSQAVT